MSLTPEQQLFELIDRSRAPLILLAENPTADAIAGAVGLADILHKLGKKAEIISTGFKQNSKLAFILTERQILATLSNFKKLILTLNATAVKEPKVEHKITDDSIHISLEALEGEFKRDDLKITEQTKYDIIFVLGAPDLESLGRIYDDNADFFFQIPIVNLDHASANEHFGELNFVNLKATSVSEIIFEIFNEYDENLISEKIATALLTGMIDKTKSFKTPNVTPKSLNIASRLMAAGATRDIIVQNLYQNKSLRMMRLWGRVLLNLELSPDAKIASAEINDKDFELSGGTEEDLPAIMEELIANIPGVEITALFLAANGETVCHLKSEKPVDWSQLVKNLPPNANRDILRIKTADDKSVILEKLRKLL